MNQNFDEGVVSAVRMCPIHGPEMLIQSFKDISIFYLVYEWQIELFGNPLERVVSLGCVFSIYKDPHIVQERAAYYVRHLVDHPRRNVEAFANQQPDQLFEMLPVFDQEQGEMQ